MIWVPNGSKYYNPTFLHFPFCSGQAGLQKQAVKLKQQTAAGESRQFRMDPMLP